MKKIILSFLIIFSMAFSTKAFAQPENHEISSELLIEEAFLRSMSGQILDAIKNYYGQVKLYYLPRITNVKKDVQNDTFDVTVQVISYERAIMPPYGQETITFRIPGFKVINFKHKEIKGEDLPKDKFRPDLSK